jgi:hypothetical protein
MEALVKEHLTLHKVLYRFLLSQTVEIIMGQVFSALNSRLAEEYGKIEIKSTAARERMLADVAYMKAKFAELKGLERETPGTVSALSLSLDDRRVLRCAHRNSSISSSPNSSHCLYDRLSPGSLASDLAPQHLSKHLPHRPPHHLRAGLLSIPSLMRQVPSHQSHSRLFPLP